MSLTAAAQHVAKARGVAPAVHPAAAALATDNKGTAADSVQTAVAQVATYIPASLIAAYTGLTALLGNQTTNLALVVFFIFLGLAPVLVVAATATKKVASKVLYPNNWKSAWPLVASAIAFTVWVAALPGSVLSAHVGWITSQVGGVAAVVGSLILGGVASIVNGADTPET